MPNGEHVQNETPEGMHEVRGDLVAPRRTHAIGRALAVLGRKQ